MSSNSEQEYKQEQLDDQEISDLLVKIEQLGVNEKPVAIEAIWDGDTTGWYLVLMVAIEKQEATDPPASNGSGSKCYSEYLTTLSDGGDIRLFNGQVPPWPESVTAQRLGSKLAARLGIPFWFPAPQEPDDDCPHWWQQAEAINCLDCAKPILRDSTRWAKNGFCHVCGWAREKQARTDK